MNEPLISVIVTTRNNHETLDACLNSICHQDYPNIELLVIDNDSTDDTKTIASNYTPNVFDKGPERSAQRNFGVARAQGAYVLIIDSDMELSPGVISNCVDKLQSQPSLAALIIPEESFGEGFWARCKRLERSYYVGVETIEAARCFAINAYKDIGGYNEHMTGGEDWDLTNRLRRAGKTIGRINAFIFHNEGRPKFTRTARKMYYYAQHAAAYFAENPTKSALTDTSGPLARYKLFFSKPQRLLKNPVVGIGMLLLKTAEYSAGALGYLQAKYLRSSDKRTA
jgi:glycosyltransferase involved in cell wall biosynthesis